MAKTFALTDKQEEKAVAWMQKQRSKKKTKDATGFRFGFAFYPTGLGPVVQVLDSLTGEHLDISEDD